MAEDFAVLETEARNPETLDLDHLDTVQLVTALNREDHKVPGAVQQVLPQVAQAVELIAARLRQGGRLFYTGAGTSGRLGVLDASECPPTFGVSPHVVQGIMAGGPNALVRPEEGAEDDPAAGAADLRSRNVGPADVVVGIAASGRTPYVIGALQEARRAGAATVALACTAQARIADYADVAILPVPGPEAVMGSTRLKAGSAQKLVLNMLSTAAMVKLGKVYTNLMVDMLPSNAKLRTRAVRMVVLATGAAAADAALALQECGHVKPAILHLLSGAPAAACRQALERAGGVVRVALALVRHD